MRAGTAVATPNFADQIHQADRTMHQNRRVQKLDEISQMVRRYSWILLVLRFCFPFLYMGTGEPV